MQQRTQASGHCVCPAAHSARRGRNCKPGMRRSQFVADHTARVGETQTACVGIEHKRCHVAVYCARQNVWFRIQHCSSWARWRRWYRSVALTTVRRRFGVSRRQVLDLRAYRFAGTTKARHMPIDPKCSAPGPGRVRHKVRAMPRPSGKHRRRLMHRGKNRGRPRDLGQRYEPRGGSIHCAGPTVRMPMHGKKALPA